MILINKTELEDKIERYCQPCRKSKNFHPLDCFDCKARSIIRIIDSIEEHTEFVALHIWVVVHISYALTLISQIMIGVVLMTVGDAMIVGENF